MEIAERSPAGFLASRERDIGDSAQEFPLSVEKPFHPTWSRSHITLRLPVVREQSNASNKSELVSRASETHQAFRIATAISVDEEMVESSVEEITSVLSVFPNITDHNTLATMAAWYFVLCHVDEEVEELEPAAGLAVLRECIEILEEHGDDELGEEISSPDTIFDPAESIRHAIRTFKAHINLLHDAVAASRLLCSVKRTLMGQVEEVFCRGEDSLGLEIYLQVREVSAGIMPFFDILELLINGTGHALSPLIRQLERKIVLTIVHQNDLVGLERDLQNGDTMNSIMVEARSSTNQSSIANHDGICALAHDAVERHNKLVDESLEIFDRIKCVSNENEVVLGEAILSFCHLHLLWALDAKRYKGGLFDTIDLED